MDAVVLQSFHCAACGWLIGALAEQDPGGLEVLEANLEAFDRVLRRDGVRERHVVAAVESALACEGIFVAINNRVSQSVPHLHVHLAPRYPGTPEDYWWTRLLDWPDAPRGGTLRLRNPDRRSSFDKFNPFTLKGTAPPGTGLLFESLLTGTMDEPTTAYGLLAEGVEVAADGLSATFRINPTARFHDGSPVMAADAKHSFDMLMSKQAAPQYRVIYSDIKQAIIVGARTIRYEFKRPNAELPLMAGGLPVFSRAWGASKPFDQVVMEIPIASGPYRIGRLNFGRDITYERDPNYWARDLNVRRGRFNFDRVTYKIYKDATAQTEAFKAGEFDYLRTFIAREWARTYVGSKFDSGELIKVELPTKNAGDFQGFLINIRREKFKDPRVRQALALAYDFEWMNKHLMYNAYTRVRGFFNASDFEATGLPGPDELAVLMPLKDKLSEKIFKEPVPLPPSTNPPGSLRDNLRKARDLTQDVFIRVFRSLSTYTPGTFEGWLHRITTNLFLDMTRRKSRLRMEGLPEDTDRLPGGGPSPEQVFHDTHLDPDLQGDVLVVVLLAEVVRAEPAPDPEALHHAVRRLAVDATNRARGDRADQRAIPRVARRVGAVLELDVLDGAAEVHGTRRLAPIEHTSDAAH